MEFNQEKMEIMMDTAIQDRMVTTTKASQEQTRPKMNVSKMKRMPQSSPFSPN
jgi:hypothetical protein